MTVTQTVIVTVAVVAGYFLPTLVEPGRSPRSTDRKILL
jgi:hypothetical protein